MELEWLFTLLNFRLLITFQLLYQIWYIEYLIVQLTLNRWIVLC